MIVEAFFSSHIWRDKSMGSTYLFMQETRNIQIWQEKEKKLSTSVRGHLVHDKSRETLNILGNCYQSEEVRVNKGSVDVIVESILLKICLHL